MLAYVELHIEQGPVLEAEGLAVGIVSAITGAGRMTVTVSGTAGHAGTTPMDRRSDALTAAAEMILAIERRCSGDAGLVGTVGQVAVGPGAVNVIPGEVVFSVDMRAGDGALLGAASADVRAEIDAVCARRGVRAEIADLGQSDGCACAPWLMDRLEAAVVAEGIAPRRLFSGAGHDAQAMAALCDVGMLFVRCEAGVSHNPDEAISAADAGVGVRVMLRFMRDFRKA